MKKSLISIIILALLVVNIVLSGITLFSVAGTNKKTAALVGDIASAISLDLETEEGAEKVTVPMKDVVTYDIAEMTIPLKKGEDGASHFAMMSITLSMNSKHKDYKAYSDLTTRESLIKGVINETVGSYTMEEIMENPQEAEDKILAGIQTLFDSDFIYDVTVSSGLYQ